MRDSLGAIFGKGLGQTSILIGTVLHVALVGTAHDMSIGVFRTCSAVVSWDELVWVMLVGCVGSNLPLRAGS